MSSKFDPTKTIGLFRFPLSVQMLIIRGMDLHETILLTTTSKKSSLTVKECLKNQKFLLLFYFNEYLELRREGAEEDTFAMELSSRESIDPVPEELWKLSKQVFVPIRMKSYGIGLRVVETFWHNKMDVVDTTLEYFLDLFPSLSLELKLKTSDLELAGKVLKWSKTVKEIRKVVVKPEKKNINHDELVKMVLDECASAKELLVSLRTSANFEYSKNLNSDKVTLLNCKNWVTPEYFMKLFMNCKHVQLCYQNYGSEDINAIITEWMESSSQIETVHVLGRRGFYDKMNLEQLPGVLSIRQAIVPFVEKYRDHYNREEPKSLNEAVSRVVRFRERCCCYLTQPSTGQRALIGIAEDIFFLTTDFQIGEGIEAMSIDGSSEEEEDESSGDDYSSSDESDLESVKERSKTTIGLLRFPFLAQVVIVEHMNLHEAIALSTISKKSHTIVKRSFKNQKILLGFHVDRELLLVRGDPEDDDSRQCMLIELTSKKEQHRSVQFLKLSKKDLIPIRLKSYERGGTTFESFWYNKLDVVDTILEYLLDLFPSLSLRLKFETSDLEVVSKVLQWSRSAKEVTHVNIKPKRGDEKENHDDLLRIVLDECTYVKNLLVDLLTSAEFKYALDKSLYCDEVTLLKSDNWVTRQQFIQVFMNCKTVELRWQNYEKRDMMAIMTKWIEGSRLEKMHVHGQGVFYNGKTIEQLPGAIPIGQAKIPFVKDYKVIRFREKCCYLIQQQNTGQQALIGIAERIFFLTTDYQIGENIDAMEVEVEDDEMSSDEEEDSSDEDDSSSGSGGEYSSFEEDDSSEDDE